MLQRGFQRTLHLDRCADADGVGDADVLHADAFHEPGQQVDTRRIDLAFIRTTDRARHRAAHVDALRARRCHDRRKALDALCDRAVDVALAEGFAGRAEHHDLVRPLVARCGDGGFETLHVGGQHGVAHSVGLACCAATLPTKAPDAAHHIDVVRHLRHPLGRHEAGDLDFLQAGVLQPLDQAQLDLGRHCLLFVLQAVARTDIDELDAGG